MTLKEKLREIRDIYSGISKREEKSTSENQDICPICHGAEWIIKDVDGVEVATPCKCRAKAIVARRKRFSDIPEGFKDKTLDTFSISVYSSPESKDKARIACKMIKTYLDDFDNQKQQGMGLYIYSATKGSGKTRIAASIANELIENHNVAVRFATSLKILSEIKQTYDSRSTENENQILNELATTDVLIIDDFGTETATAWVKDKVYDIVNQRYIGKKVTIFTSNESLKTLAYDERIASRIKEMCYQIDFPEESVRDSIAEKNMKTLFSKIV